MFKLYLLPFEAIGAYLIYRAVSALVTECGAILSRVFEVLK